MIRRLPGLDVLRAIAITWVLFFHAETLSLGSPFPPVTSFGWIGVDLFFVLSGFLIGRQWFVTLEAGTPRPFREFYLRRALRIFPAYLVVLAIYFALPATRERAEIQPLWQFLTFTENLFIDAFRAKTFSHVWSLCVEEHFYLAFPLLGWALLRRPSSLVTVAVCLLIGLGGMALRAHEWFDAVAPQAGLEGPGNLGQRYFERIYYPTPTRLDGLLVGVMLAVIESRRSKVWALAMRRPGALLAMGMCALAASVMLFQDTRAAAPTIIGYPLVSIAMGCFVVAAASLKRGMVPGAAFIATISYSLYLSHKMAFFLLRTWAGDLLGRHGVLALAAYASAALLFGALLYFGVERPFLKLRERLTAASSGSGPSTPRAASPGQSRRPTPRASA